MISDDENNQAVSKEAFEVLHLVAAKRLSLGKLTVVDATNVQPEARNALIALAHEYHCSPVALVLNLPEVLCLRRNEERPNRKVAPSVVHLHCQQLQISLSSLDQEGFQHIYILHSIEEVDAVEIIKTPQSLWDSSP
jgi:protein phosphatase